MTGGSAYLTYSNTYNDFNAEISPNSLSGEAFIELANTMLVEMNLMPDDGGRSAQL